MGPSFQLSAPAPALVSSAPPPTAHFPFQRVSTLRSRPLDVCLCILMADSDARNLQNATGAPAALITAILAALGRPRHGARQLTRLGKLEHAPAVMQPLMANFSSWSWSWSRAAPQPRHSTNTYGSGYAGLRGAEYRCATNARGCAILVRLSFAWHAPGAHPQASPSPTVLPESSRTGLGSRSGSDSFHDPDSRAQHPDSQPNPCFIRRTSKLGLVTCTSESDGGAACDGMQPLRTSTAFAFAQRRRRREYLEITLTASPSRATSTIQY